MNLSPLLDDGTVETQTFHRSFKPRPAGDREWEDKHHPGLASQNAEDKMLES